MNQTSRSEKLLSMICFAFFIYTMIAIPLYVEDKFFNMLEAKWHAFTMGTLVMLPVAICVLIFTRTVARDFNTLNKNEKLPKLTGLEWLLAAFGISAVISAAFSDDFRMAFWGLDGWHVGAFTIAAIAVWCVILGRYMPLVQNTWLIVMAINIFMVVLAVLHAMEIDAFWMHKNAALNHYHEYLSTLGQMTWIVGYLSLLFPLFLGFYINSDDKTSERIYEIFLLALCMLMVLTGSDGMYLAVGVMSFGLIPYAFADAERLTKLLKVVIMYGACLLAVGSTPLFAGKRDSMMHLAAFFVRPPVAILIVVAGSLGLVLVKRLHSEAGLRKARGTTFGLLGVAVIVALTLSFKGFNQRWGSGRGWIWTNSLQFYRNFTLKEKLLGVGPEMLRQSYEKMSESFGKPLLTAHSEPIQILLTMGVLGFIIWAAICVYILVRFIKTRAWRDGNCIYYMPLLAYFGQSLVNSAMTTNIAVLIIMLAIFEQNVYNITVNSDNDGKGTGEDI